MDAWSTYNSGPYGFKSTWRDKRNPVDAGIQTDRLSYVETGCQVKVTSGIQTQTNPDPLLDFKEQKEPYPPSLYAFFAKVTGPMCEALAENLNPIYGLSAAMSALMADGDSGQDQADADAEGKDVATKLYDLRSPTASEDCCGSCVAWNCQGTQVAIGYGESWHDGWCTHQAPLSVWSIGRLRNLQQQQDGSASAAVSPPPHKELILPACMTALDFHPTNPSLLAVGLHSGEVVLIDLHASNAASTDSHVDGPKKRATSGILRRSASDGKTPDEGVVNADGIFHVLNRSLHSAEVVSVKWVSFPESSPSLARKNPSPAQHMILTAGKDGLIGLWSVNKTYNRLYLEKRIVILPRNLPEEIDHKTQLIVSMKEIGVTALAPCRQDPTTFAVGTFGCYLFQCDVSSQDELDPSLELDVILPSRMVAELVNGNPRYLRQGRGYVNGLDYSPFHQNLVLASTIHGHVELINTLKPDKPVLELAMAQDEGLDVKWAGRPMVLGVGWANTLSVYDLMQSDATPAVNVEHKEPLSSFAFNKKEFDLLATADENGRLHIWQLPSSFKAVTDKQVEMNALIKLGNI